MAADTHHRRALEQILGAERPFRAWSTDAGIPWDDPDFSKRVLEVHLDPSTHMASRSPDVISQHLDWLERLETGAEGLRVLDIGCGPGLYCHGLARRGYRATGVDIAPAAIAYAQEVSDREQLDCAFHRWNWSDLPGDLAEQIGPVDVVTLWYGEFQSVPRNAAPELVNRLAGCLRPGGLLVLEIQPWDLMVQEPSSEWGAFDSSFFCPVPHLWLQEFEWDDEADAEVHVHWIIERESGNLHRYQRSHQGYRPQELTRLLADTGFADAVYYPPVAGLSEEHEFPLVVARFEPKAHS